MNKYIIVYSENGDIYAEEFTDKKEVKEWQKRNEFKHVLISAFTAEKIKIEVND